MMGKTKPICLGCNKEKAIEKQPYGWGYGKRCLAKQKKYQVSETVELTSEDIKVDRKIFDKDIQQRYAGDKPNLRYMRTYGTKGYTPEEIKQARVMDGYYQDREARFHE